MSINITLSCDGSSDAALKPIIDWTIRQRYPGVLTEINVKSSSLPLAGRVRQALRLFPCDLLIVHRDAETQGRETREREWADAQREFEQEVPRVLLVPVRMTETWLLVNEEAIRRAAGNPNGTMDLTLPAIRDLERLPDPKSILKDLLLRASGLPPRRARQFDFGQARFRIAELGSDYGALRDLTAFQRFEHDLINAMSPLI